MTTANGGKNDAGIRVRAVVLSHAADLFAERGPAATSLRDIAERSGINAGLIFRHIGNKESIVSAVLDYLEEDLAAARDTDMPRNVIEARGERSWKVIARSLLDGFDVGRLQHRFSNVEQLVAAAREHHGDEYTARVATADALALRLGWHLFGPFLKTATGLDDFDGPAVGDVDTDPINDQLGDPRKLGRR